MLVAVCSVKGSPGVTTFCMALAAQWPAQTRCVLLECDPSGGDLATRFALVVFRLGKTCNHTRSGKQKQLYFFHGTK